MAASSPLASLRTPHILAASVVVVVLFLVFASGATTTSLHEAKKLTAGDAQAGDNFGASVAFSDDTAIVGAFLEDAGGSGAGAAYILGRNEGGPDNWGEVAKLTASDAAGDDNFGVGVAISGDTAIVGAWQIDSSGTGAAYIFERDEGGIDNWGEVKKLTASDAEAGDQFGIAVGISSDTIVVGARADDDGGSGAGAAYVFERDAGGADNWGEVKKLAASDADAGDVFGTSVAISGDTTLVGAFGESAFTGAGYIFERDEGGVDNWGEIAKLTASDAALEDRFGVGVAISNDTVVVGAQNEDTNGPFSGAAYVFDRDAGGGNNWGEVKKLTPSDAQALDVFGASVAASGDTVVVGAFFQASRGAAYHYERDQGGPGSWGEVKKLTASDAEVNDWLGIGLAVGADTAIAGAPNEDAEGSAAGAAYVFDLTLPKPTPTATKQPDPGDTDLDGCSDAEENGGNAQAGGMRDYKNFWDFYDVDTENLEGAGTHLQGAIGLSDIFEVAGRFGQVGDPGIDPLSDASGAGYHTRYDRGPQTGANLWNRGPADGAVALSDVFAIAAQFAHSCI